MNPTLLVLLLAVVLSLAAPAPVEANWWDGWLKAGEDVAAKLAADKLCTKYCDQEWNGDKDCVTPCSDAVMDKRNECHNSKGIHNMQAFWSGCSFGEAIAKKYSCEQVCEKVGQKSHLSMYFQFGCTSVCNKFMDKAKAKGKLISCHNSACNYVDMEMCWRGCNYGK
jgi:hypothetical protein